MRDPASGLCSQSRWHPNRLVRRTAHRHVAELALEIDAVGFARQFYLVGRCNELMQHAWYISGLSVSIGGRLNARCISSPCVGKADPSSHCQARGRGAAKSVGSTASPSSLAAAASRSGVSAASQSSSAACNVGQPGTSATRAPSALTATALQGREPHSSKIATARVQPAEAPLILWGKQLTVKPLPGSASRLCSFSRWQ